MRKNLLIIILSFFILTVHGEENKNINFWSDIENEKLANLLIEQMTNEELLSQILMFGWAGQEPSDLLNSWVTKRGLGSVKVFGWNTDDTIKVAKSIKFLQEEARSRPLQIPLFVATDQEGGWIRHVKGETSDTPGNMAIGASSYPIDAYYSGYYINKEISVLGINMNFAPTVDLYTDLDSSVIGPRSFGSNPNAVGILGEAFSKGSLDAGVIPTAKHFPGHGDTSLDSHGKLPQINIDYKTLTERELIPFKYLIKAKIPAIMSGHLSFPKIEKNGTPASLSKKFLTDILRNELGYEGLIITYDMMMNGATLFAGSFHRAVTMAIEAGNDIIISSTTANLNDNMWNLNLNKMKNDSAFFERVKEAATRVIKAKLDYFKSENAAPLFPDENKIFEEIPNKEGQKFFIEQACRSLTILKSDEKFPLKSNDEEKILIAGPFISLFNEGKVRYPNAKTFHYSYELKSDRSNYDSWDAVGLVSTAKNFDTIIICVFDKHSANIAKRLRYLNKNVIILSIMSPVFVLSDFEWANTILCGYSYSDYSFKALFAALNGEITARGIIPLNQ
jgi:beta-N-acetylhexosaminidase